MSERAGVGARYNGAMGAYGVEITVYALVVAGLLGLVMGSFVNCWAWRAIRGESVLAGRSHCATCGHVLAARDLVPVLSWLAAGRKCRYCAQPISARYPATELVSAAAYVAIVASFGLSLETLEMLAFASILLFLSLTDIDDFTIPNGCIAAALGVRAAYLAITFALGQTGAGDIAYYAGSALAVGVALVVVVLIADKAFGRPSMGGGDLKLFVVAAFYFGWQQCLFLVIVSCVLGIASSLLLPAREVAPGNAEAPGDTEAPGAAAPASPRAAAPAVPGQPDSVLKRSFPFGPSIAVACLVTMFAGPQFVSWYLGLL